MSASYHDRVAALREAFAAEEIDGFIVPRADEYQGEYVPESADRLRWISGFTGSAGYAIVLKDKAGVFSDGRYTIQLKQQIDASLFETGDSTKMSAGEWIAKVAPHSVIGYDPRLHTPRDIKTLEDKGVKLKAVLKNPLDAIWKDRPAAPASKVEIFPIKYAGRTVQEKLDQVAATLKDLKAQAALITLPDSIAWLLNVRAHDIPHIPVPLSTAIVYADATVDWFIDDKRVGDDVRKSFGNRVSLAAPGTIEKAIAALKGKKTLVDERRAGRWFTDRLKEAGVETLDAKDPCIALKARKNEAEIAAMRAAHVRDGAAVTKFLCWFHEEGPKGNLTEMDVEAKLVAFREESPLCRDSSFDTIAGFGGNGAIVHYRATKETNRTIEPDGILLLDSGAQYADGTTDITRTIAVGKPTEEMKRHFTLVLKGHIALARAIFAKGTTGIEIDKLARGALQAEGLDYAHGTGHGVGVYLSVHEESASISPRGADALDEGMILSNEPGYYLEEQYGIRIENLVLVIDAGNGMLGFETLTLAPIDPTLVAFPLLTPDEKEWLKIYHSGVQEQLLPFLDGATRDFLSKIVSRYS